MSKKWEDVLEASREYEVIIEDPTCDELKKRWKKALGLIEGIISETAAHKNQDSRVYYEHVVTRALATLVDETVKVIQSSKLPELRQSEMICQIMWLSGRKTWLHPDSSNNIDDDKNHIKVNIFSGDMVIDDGRQRDWSPQYHVEPEEKEVKEDPSYPTEEPFERERTEN